MSDPNSKSPENNGGNNQEKYFISGQVEKDSRTIFNQGKFDNVSRLPETRKSDIQFNTRALPRDAMTYELEKFQKNYLLIFNHVNVEGHSKPRSGTYEDAEELVRTFEKWGFVYEVLNDMKKEEILIKLEEMACKDFSDYGCVVVVVLTHGGRNGLIYASDTSYSELEIIDRLHAHKNPTLLTKPRLVLIQACRGEKNLKGITTGTPVEIEKDHETGEVYTLPDEADMLLFHSSYMGKASHRERVGSWFIQSFCSKINEMSAMVDLEAILTDVRREVAIEKCDVEYNTKTRTFDINKQMPVSTSTLTRKLYLRRYGETPQNDSESDRALPKTPTVPLSPCTCFSAHFTYIKECMRLFMADKTDDQHGMDILDLVNEIDHDSTRNQKEVAAKKICNYLRKNGKGEKYDFLYYYIHKEEEKS